MGQPQEWQREVWGYFYTCPEFGNAVLFVGNALSKIRLFPAVRPLDDPTGEPIPAIDPESGIPPELAKEAQDQLDRLRSDMGGTPAFLGALAMNIEAVAECYVVGIMARTVDPEAAATARLKGEEPPEAQPERWMVLSISEVELKNKQTIIKLNGGRGFPLEKDKGDVAFRVWLPDPQWSTRAHCASRHCLPEMRILNALTAQVLASTNSQMHSGILFLSNRMTFGGEAVTPKQGEEHRQSPFEDALDESFATPIEDPDDLLTVRPMVVMGDPDDIAASKHMTLSRPVEEALDRRIDQHTGRLSRGIALPVEVVQGHMSTTFANAEQVDQDTFDDFLEPRCRTMVDGLTVGFLRPELTGLHFGEGLEGPTPPDPATQAAIDRIITWYDPAELVANPDTDGAADKGLDSGAISAAAWRRVKGFTEADAPEDDELVIGTGLRRGTLTAELTAAMLKPLADAAGIELPSAPDELSPTPSGPAAAIPASSRLIRSVPVPVTAAGRNAPLGQALTDIDVRLHDRLQVAFSMAIERALEKATAKLRTRAQRSKTYADVARTATNRDLPRILGPAAVSALLADAGEDEDDLLDGAWVTLAPLYRTQVGNAQRAARGQAARKVTLPDVSATQADDAEEAWAWTEAELSASTKRALFTDVAQALQGEADPDMRTPAGLVRQSMARAGGERGIETRGAEGDYLTLIAGTNEPAGGVATGTTVMGALKDEGVTVDGFTWVWTDSGRPFEPHEALDGVTFTSYDDPVLANPDPWPPFEFWFGGDHLGCGCLAEPTLLDADGNPI